jgi:hypothetical protein
VTSHNYIYRLIYIYIYLYLPSYGTRATNTVILGLFAKKVTAAVISGLCATNTVILGLALFDDKIGSFCKHSLLIYIYICDVILGPRPNLIVRISMAFNVHPPRSSWLNTVPRHGTHVSGRELEADAEVGVDGRPSC